MIEENYSTNLYGRVKQTVTSLDDSLQEIYYINVKAAGDINMAQYIKEYRKSENGEALDKIAELLRNYRTEYKDLSSLYLFLPDERIAVTSEDYPVCKRDIPEEEIVKIRQTEAEEAVPIMFGDMVHDRESSSPVFSPLQMRTVLCWDICWQIRRRGHVFYEYLEPVYDGKVSQALILDKNREMSQVRIMRVWDRFMKVWTDYPRSAALRTRTQKRSVSFIREHFQNAAYTWISGRVRSCGT